MHFHRWYDDWEYRNLLGIEWQRSRTKTGMSKFTRLVNDWCHTLIWVPPKQASTAFAYLLSLTLRHMKGGSNTSILNLFLFSRSHKIASWVSGSHLNIICNFWTSASSCFRSLHKKFVGKLFFSQQTRQTYSFRARSKMAVALAFLSMHSFRWWSSSALRCIRSFLSKLIAFW